MLVRPQIRTLDLFIKNVAIFYALTFSPKTQSTKKQPVFLLSSSSQIRFATVPLCAGQTPLAGLQGWPFWQGHDHMIVPVGLNSTAHTTNLTSL